MSHAIKSDNIIYICGMRGSGKTTFTKQLLTQITTPIIIWDYNWEYKPLGYVIVHNLKDLIEAAKTYRLIIYQPLEKTFTHFDQFCLCSFQYDNYMLVIEEVELFATSHNIPPNFKKIIDIGRHKGIGLICTARRTLRTNPDIPYNANHIIMFKQHRPQDLQYLATFCGEDVWKLQKLPDYNYLWYDGRTLTVHTPV